MANIKIQFATPRKRETVSPQLAAAPKLASMEKGRVITNAALNTFDYIRQQEAKVRAKKQEAEVNYKINNFLADPRWELPSIDGKPTEEVMQEEWTALVDGAEGEGGLRGDLPNIPDKALREGLNTSISSMVGLGSVKAKQIQIKTQINRMSLDHAETRDLIKRTGGPEKWIKLDESTTLGIEAGILTDDEVAKERAEVRLGRITDEYTLNLANMTDEELVAREEKARTDGRLDHDERTAISGAIASYRNDRDAWDEKQSQERSDAVVRDIWTNPNEWSPDRIANDPNITDEDAVTNMKALRTATGASLSDTDEGLAQVNTLLFGVADGTISLPKARTDLINLARNGLISKDTFQKEYGNIAKNYKELLFNPTEKEIVRSVLFQLTGTPIDDIASFFENEKNAVLRQIAQDIVNQFTDNKFNDPLGFDFRKFRDEKIDGWKKQVKAVKAGSISGDAALNLSLSKIATGTQGLEPSDAAALMQQNLDNTMDRMTPQEVVDLKKNLNEFRKRNGLLVPTDEGDVNE